jgi:hypothetical protein
MVAMALQYKSKNGAQTEEKGEFSYLLSFQTNMNEITFTTDIG